MISASYGLGSALIEIDNRGDEWETKEIWHNERLLRAKFSNSVYHKGFVYGLDEGMLTCIDPIKGEETWKKKSRARQYKHGQLLLTGDHLLITSETGDLVLVEANPNKFNEIWKIPALKQSGRVWNPPALVDGIAYLRDHQFMAAYNLNTKNPETSTTTETPTTETSDSNLKTDLGTPEKNPPIVNEKKTNSNED